MRHAIGVALSERITVGLVEGSRIVGDLRSYPGPEAAEEDLLAMPAEQIAAHIAVEVSALAAGADVAAVGVGFPGIIRGGVLEESPNLQQLKGCNLQAQIRDALKASGLNLPVALYNDADVMAAGLAATRGQLDKTVRVWTLGAGIGYGQYPWSDGFWEGGHMVVTLDPKERFCACGGRGHLEGIMGHRGMRMRFLDLEPEEVFEAAGRGDQRCVDFVRLWHRALAAATASVIHLGGPGRFFVTGHNAEHIDLPLLHRYLAEMVKMSPLQGYVFEVVTSGDEIAVIGAAVNAERGAA
jgi:predicted NBD/HSP70 family sugar kinase